MSILKEGEIFLESDEIKFFDIPSSIAEPPILFIFSYERFYDYFTTYLVRHTSYISLYIPFFSLFALHFCFFLHIDNKVLLIDFS